MSQKLSEKGKNQRLSLLQTVFLTKITHLSIENALILGQNVSISAQKDRFLNDFLGLKDASEHLKAVPASPDSGLKLAQNVTVDLIKSRFSGDKLLLSHAVSLEMTQAPRVVIIRVVGKQLQLSGPSCHKIVDFLNLCGFSDAITVPEAVVGKLVMTLSLELLKNNPIEALTPLLEACRIRPTVKALNSLI